MPSLALTPRGHLLFTGADDAPQPAAAGLSRTLEGALPTDALDLIGDAILADVSKSGGVV